MKFDKVYEAMTIDPRVIRGLIPKEYADFATALYDANLSAECFALLMKDQIDPMLVLAMDYEKVNIITDAYENMQEAFIQETDLYFELDFHDKKKYGSDKDTIDGIFYEIMNFCSIPSSMHSYIKSKLGLKKVIYTVKDE